MAGLVQGKTALITGAASGIGRAAALAFGREGARVLLADRDTAVVAADVTREEEVAALVRAAAERFGRLDCAHNNAGITGAMGGIQDLTLAGWEQTLAVNLTGVFLCLKHELA